ncbi:MAG: hypothetical protein MH472_14660 [Bacteroidia bacterium]|nr:hypothetical protein [Bacteroidia bacterium]
MIQTKTILLLISSILLLVTNCKKKEITMYGDRLPSWGLNFYFADSLGNNLLTYNLPENPVRNPEEFRAFCVYETADFAYAYRRHELYGYTFEIVFDKLINIEVSESYQKDSVFKFYVCFGNNCDTVVVRPNIIKVAVDTRVIAECGAEWVAWGRDTTFNHPCSFFLVNLK